jgi:hypothetical protein
LVQCLNRSGAIASMLLSSNQGSFQKLIFCSSPSLKMTERLISCRTLSSTLIRRIATRCCVARDCNDNSEGWTEECYCCVCRHAVLAYQESQKRLPWTLPNLQPPTAHLNQEWNYMNKRMLNSRICYYNIKLVQCLNGIWV